MSNAWNVTKEEYLTALKRCREGEASTADLEAYWQLVRFYRGDVFYRDEAERGVRLVRGQP